MLEQRIQQQFFDSADLLYAAAESLSKPMADAAHAIVGCITAGGKVMAFGQAGSAHHAQNFAHNFLGRFERERPALAAMVLGGEGVVLQGAGDEAELNAVAAKQVQALGQPGDVLLLITAVASTGAAVLQAVAAAHRKDMVVVALTGRSSAALSDRLIETDVHISVPHDRAARIHEVHTLVIHCLCDAVDLQLLGEQVSP